MKACGGFSAASGPSRAAVQPGHMPVRGVTTRCSRWRPAVSPQASAAASAALRARPEAARALPPDPVPLLLPGPGPAESFIVQDPNFSWDSRFEAVLRDHCLSVQILELYPDSPGRA